jgi:integrase
MGAKPREKPKGSGYWAVVVHHQKYRTSKRIGKGPACKRAAEALAAIVSGRLAQGLSPFPEAAPEHKPASPTVAEYYPTWWQIHAAFCSSSTRINYEQAFRRIWLPELGSTRLADLTHDRISTVVARLVTDGQYKPGSVKTLLIPFRVFLNAAVVARHIPADPSKGVGKLIKKLAPADRDDEFDPADLFTRDELEQIIETARRDMPEHYALILTLARTGARIGEALALRVDDIDHTRGELVIQNTLNRLGEVSPKTKGKRKRRVELSNQLKAALIEQESLVRAEAALRGTQPPLLLFPQYRRRSVSSWRQAVWRVLLRRAGFRYRRPHLVRHSFASLLLQDGVPLAYVSEVLGHGSVAVTAKVYAHALPNANRGALNRLDPTPSRTPRAPKPDDRALTI